jgi:DNA polymerase III subunit delta'
VALAEDLEDPREVIWHPRFATHIVGHDEAFSSFKTSVDAGRPHHAWLIGGPQGIGKATLAYGMARYVLAKSMAPDQVDRWIGARAHPDMAVLERSFNDAKPRKLRAEISVDDVRRFIDFFARTSSGGGWRVGLVDAADDLSSESANALLKLVEEPPSKTIILLVSHTPGRVLRTLRSRCRRLPLGGLTEAENISVLNALPLEPAISPEALAQAARISGGSPGLALQLMGSQGAKAFQAFIAAKRLDAASRQAIGQYFSTRATAQYDVEVFFDLLLEWLALKAKSHSSQALATLHADLARQKAIVSGYNLDRRVAVMDTLAQVDLALKAA